MLIISLFKRFYQYIWGVLFVHIGMLLLGPYTA